MVSAARDSTFPLINVKPGSIKLKHPKITATVRWRILIQKGTSLSATTAGLFILGWRLLLLFHSQLLVLIHNPMMKHYLTIYLTHIYIYIYSIYIYGLYIYMCVFHRKTEDPRSPRSPTSCDIQQLGHIFPPTGWLLGDHKTGIVLPWKMWEKWG